MKLQKNVSNTTIQDIKLNCTVESVKAVADAVTRLQIRMGFLEQDMSVVAQLAKEISELKEFVMNKKKEDTDIPY